MTKAKVRLFARLSELAGAREVEVEVGEGLSAAEVYKALCREYPALSGLNGSLRYAVNGEYAEGSHPVSDGDEVALIPPVSGGAELGEPQEVSKAPGLGALASILVPLLLVGFAVVSGLGWLTLYNSIVDGVDDRGTPEDLTVHALRSLTVLSLVVWFALPWGLGYIGVRAFRIDAIVMVVILLPFMLAFGAIELVWLSWANGCHLDGGFPIPGVGEACDG